MLRLQRTSSRKTSAATMLGKASPTSGANRPNAASSLSDVG